MAAKYRFILDNEVISSTTGALVVVTAYWEALKKDFWKYLGFCPKHVPPTNNLKFKLLAFWRKWTPFIGQKCTYEKVAKNWAGPSPHLDKIQKNRAFFRMSSLFSDQTIS